MLKKAEEFRFLKVKINRKLNLLKKILVILEESRNLKSVICFPIIKNYRRSDIIKNKDYFEKKDIYKDKYEEKDLYTATLIPEYGSWIRLSFLRDKKIDIYKYPITNRYEDDIVIQIDKIIKKPIIHLLREMGLKDLEISKNLKHSDYFYFNSPLLTTSVNSNNPLLRFNIDDPDKNISEFSRIFDSRYYRLGKIGRYKLNQRFNLKISQEFFSITYDDIFAIIDYLITLCLT
jgi:DNA-directed RNA polymerase subunit beta